MKFRYNVLMLVLFCCAFTLTERLYAMNGTPDENPVQTIWIACAVWAGCDLIRYFVHRYRNWGVVP